MQYKIRGYISSLSCLNALTYAVDVSIVRLLFMEISINTQMCGMEREREENIDSEGFNFYPGK